MKKSKIAALMFIYSVSTLVGCQNSNSKITIHIGTKEDQMIELKKENDLISILSSKLNEDVLLATYSDIYSTGCACWIGFKEEVANKFVKNYNIPIYFFNTDLLTESTIKQFKISKLTNSNPNFYLFKNSKVLRKYSYDDKVKNIFTYDTFVKELNQKINKPENFSMFYVTYSYLFNGDKNHINDEKTVILNMRNACSDCSYAIPNIIQPYLNNKKIKNEIYLLDYQFYRDTTEYENIKNQLNLKESKFGYKEGVFPTIQYREKGVLLDSCVTFNDVLEEQNDKYIIKESYYTDERLNNLTFLKNSSISKKVLLGLEIDKSDVKNGFWSLDKASEYHKPILEKFLETYCL